MTLNHSLSFYLVVTKYSMIYSRKFQLKSSTSKLNFFIGRWMVRIYKNIYRHFNKSEIAGSTPTTHGQPTVQKILTTYHYEPHTLKAAAQRIRTRRHTKRTRGGWKEKLPVHFTFIGMVLYIYILKPSTYQ